MKRRNVLKFCVALVLCLGLMTAAGGTGLSGGHAAAAEAVAEETPWQNPFRDVAEDAWYYDAVRYVTENGLMNGTSGSVFAPDGATSRAMVITMLWRLEGRPVVNYLMTFEDVPGGTYYTEAVRWAASERIIGGYTDQLFGPHDPVTREQLVVMLYRYAQYKGYDVSVGENTNILSYTDFDQLGESAIPAMQWACGAGIVKGTTDTTLGPQEQATRAQSAMMLTRLCGQYADSAK
jgi:hypothetical protein